MAARRGTGVALASHKGKLYASFGHNKGLENTFTEEGRYRVSSGGGTTWSDIRTLDVGTDRDDLAVSHGVFPGGLGESHQRAALSYPYAIENAGQLYVGYSNSGGRGGNQNSAEMAVISVTKLAVH